jgi:Xaa-Pro aminopeptidase
MNGLERLRTRLDEAGVGALALAPSDNLRHAAGFAPVADERACVLLLTPRATAFVVPELNADQTAAALPGLPILRWSDHEGPAAALAAAVASLGEPPDTLAVDPEMRAETLLALLAAVPGARPVDGGPLIRPVREIKAEDEIAAIRRSGATADAAVGAAVAACRPGATELEVAAAVQAEFSAQGAEEVVFVTVASGPNGAFPHYAAGTRELAAGDAVVIDIGGRLDGYASDITRMVHVGEPDARYREVHDIVERAVVAALAAARPGATCGDVDAAARGVIADAGYGPQFLHRTGHGLGLSTHEPPWIMAGDATVLRAGMVFSIEPGIYLDGDFGVRREEIVALRDDGPEIVSGLPRDLQVVPA